MKTDFRLLLVLLALLTTGCTTQPHLQEEASNYSLHALSVRYAQMRQP